MTRETKIGLIIAGSFLCLVCIVVVSKLRQGDAPPSEPDHTQVASNQGNEGAPENGAPNKEDKAKPSSSIPMLPVNSLPGRRMPSDTNKKVEDLLEEQVRESKESTAPKKNGPPGPLPVNNTTSGPITLAAEFSSASIPVKPGPVSDPPTPTPPAITPKEPPKTGLPGASAPPGLPGLGAPPVVVANEGAKPAIPSPPTGLVDIEPKDPPNPGLPPFSPMVPAPGVVAKGNPKPPSTSNLLSPDGPGGVIPPKAPPKDPPNPGFPSGPTTGDLPGVAPPPGIVVSDPPSPGFPSGTPSSALPSAPTEIAPKAGPKPLPAGDPAPGLPGPLAKEPPKSPLPAEPRVTIQPSIPAKDALKPGVLSNPMPPGMPTVIGPPGIVGKDPPKSGSPAGDLPPGLPSIPAKDPPKSGLPGAPVVPPSPGIGAPDALKPAIPGTPPGVKPSPEPIVNEVAKPPVPPPITNTEESPFAKPVPTIVGTNVQSTSPIPVPTPPGPPPGAMPIPATPPMNLEANKPATPVISASMAYDVCRPGETSFAKLSERFYGTDKYADALLAYNQSARTSWSKLNGMTSPPTSLAPGIKVLKPQPALLERDYPQMIGRGTTSPIAPIAASGPVVKVETPRPIATIAPPTNSAIPTITNTPKAGPTAPYRVQNPQGESILDIAERTLGNRSRWNEIYRLNPNYPPQFPIPAGTELRMPGN